MPQPIDGARYPSFGLRFDVKGAYEDLPTFLKRKNKQELTDGEKRKKKEDAGKWVLGEAPNHGSIHSNVWKGKAIDLAQKDALIIYPVNGWWRFRPQSPEICNKKTKYALVMTLETSADVDLYTSIANIVATSTQVATV